MKKYWVMCENEKGDGSGCSFYSRYDAIETAKKLTKYFTTVYVQFDTGFTYLTIWRKSDYMKRGG